MGLFNLLAQTQEAVPVTTSVPTEELVQTTQTTIVVSQGLSGAAMLFMILWIVFVVLAIVAVWRIFTKAGEAGWKSIIPIYNVLVLLKIIGKPWWYLLLLFIPIVNIFVSVIIALELGKAFGKDAVFSIVLLFFFNVIGYLILGFGDAKYVRPGGSVAAPTAASPTAN